MPRHAPEPHGLALGATFLKVIEAVDPTRSGEIEQAFDLPR